MSFLDVIYCGFGAVILLPMTTKSIPPTVLEQSATHLDGTVVARQEAPFQIRGETEAIPVVGIEKAIRVFQALDKRICVYGVGMPTLLHANPPASFLRFALMRELAYRNGSSFVGLPNYQ